MYQSDEPHSKFIFFQFSTQITITAIIIISTAAVNALTSAMKLIKLLLALRRPSAAGIPQATVTLHPYLANILHWRTLPTSVEETNAFQ
jgi:hypothetical protein